MKRLIMAAVVVTGLAVGSEMVCGEIIRVAGSASVGKSLFPKLSEAYQARRPGVRFQVSTGHSGQAFHHLAFGKAQLGLACRRPKVPERQLAGDHGVALQPHLVGYEAVAVIVHASNPVSNISRAALLGIYEGKIRDWKAVGGVGDVIHPYAGCAGSESTKSLKESRNFANMTIQVSSEPNGCGAVFQEQALRGHPWDSDIPKVKDAASMVKAVAQDPKAIGFVPFPTGQLPPGVKIIAVDGVFPSEAAVRSHKYGLARPILFYTNGKPKGEVENFIRFAQSMEGQRLVAGSKFISLR
ncbi:substrate-binding domain-containing protein [Candidatus Methylacidithermus pantelleriae]|uniref:Phosphate ABC transporter, periplasmic phosphate-binding protein PstS (TC 3.A.1.7.1) n=1 Tax=Candidatus Methylacidithermus pantelleriae TaxID=2744239 RepID=A0A8J2BQ25_9BACT|nr:substrate-binding domain-containing protein [Candidatus Methylacidithermus pantelleriae]CAF0698303.1 Phosphate ABC transporter, periplasmic phosphate-binding protein PstS (TC 3.A.1.7.1) [Candidatus Methylacidithermus pantelleriae]